MPEKLKIKFKKTPRRQRPPPPPQPEDDAVAGTSSDPATASSSGAPPKPKKPPKRPKTAKTAAELEADRRRQAKCREKDALRIHPCSACYMVLKTKATLRQHLRDVHDVSVGKLAEPYWQDVMRGRERTAEDDDDEY